MLAFCQVRSLSTDGLALRQRVDIDPVTKLPTRIRLEIQLPSSFPDKYRSAVTRAVEGCKVKKTIAAAPAMEVTIAQSDRGLAKASSA